MTELGLILAISVACLAFAGYLTRWVLSRPAGEAELARVSALVRRAAERFGKRQTNTIGALSAALAGAVFLAYGLRSGEGAGDPVSGLGLGVWLTVSFAVGSLSSLAAGQVAIWMTTRANARVASGARRSLDFALQVAMRSGAVVGIAVLALGHVAVAGLFLTAMTVHGSMGTEPVAVAVLVPFVPFLVMGYALGVSFAALLAHFGGATFAKAADLAADLGARAVGLTEDDPHNPATIADLAGDGVGGAATRATGFLAAAAAESLGTMLVAAYVFRHNEGAFPSATAVILFPLVARVFGLIGAVFGVMVVRTDDREDPQSALMRGMYVTALLQLAGFAGAANWLLPDHWVYVFSCGAAGVLTTVALAFLTQAFSDPRQRPVRELSESSRAGPTLNVLAGVSAGLDAAGAKLLAVLIVIAAAYGLGSLTHLHGGGLLGVGLAATGLVGMGAYVLAMDASGPIVDNAGGIVEMTIGRERPDVRGRTLVLNGVGTSVKVLARSFLSAVSAIAALLLVSAYLDEVRRRVAVTDAPAPLAGLRFDAPLALSGGLLGVCLIFWLGARAAGGAARSARRLIDEVKRQLRDRPPGRAAEPPPDSDIIVEMTARFALRHMVAPALVAALAPVALGLGLRLAASEDNPLVVADVVAAFLMAATVAGVAGSLVLGAAGGAWDNAKKYIVTGAHGGRFVVDESGDRAESPTFYAAVVGDTVGDPLKDIASPAMVLSAKMLPTVTLILLPFFL